AANIPAGSGTYIIYDTATPTAVITAPVLASTSGVISLAIASGTASGDSGISNVKIAIQSLANNQWIDASLIFEQPSATFINATSTTGAGAGAATWSFNPAGLSSKFNSGTAYWIVVEAISPSNLTQNSFALNISSMLVVVD